MAEVDIFENVFDRKFCGWLLEDARKSLRSGSGYARSNYHWDEKIVKSSQAVLVKDHAGPIKKLIIDQLNNKGIVSGDNYGVMTYAWTRLSYIPWHNDGHRDISVTIYLNEAWDEDWGGLFLYKNSDRDLIKGYAPKYNTAIRNKAHVYHATSLITVDAAEPRFTIQIFSRS